MCARSLYHSVPHVPSQIRLVQSNMLYGEAQSHYTYLLTDGSLELIPLPSNYLQQHNSAERPTNAYHSVRNITTFWIKSECSNAIVFPDILRSIPGKI